MIPVECRESLEGIAYFIAQNAFLGDEDLSQVQWLAKKSLAILSCYIPSCTSHTCYHGIYDIYHCTCSYTRGNTM